MALSLWNQGSTFSSFFWYIFDTCFLSKLYTINHYPQGWNPSLGVPENYAHIRQFIGITVSVEVVKHSLVDVISHGI
jgi:hypothetical protein